MTAPSLRFAGTVAVGSSGASSLAITVPSGIEVGDLLVMSLVTWGSGTPVLAGWTLLRSTSGSRGGLNVFARVATAGDDGHTYTPTFTASSGNKPVGVIDAWQDTFGVDVSATGVTTTQFGQVATATRLTTARYNEQVIVVWAYTGGNIGGGGTYSATTIHEHDSTDTGNEPIFGVSSQAQASPGQASAQTATLDGSGQLGGWAAVTLALYGNNPPNAPTLTGPATGVTLDGTATQRFSWTFSDSDPGDSQSAFDLRYSSDSGATWTTVSATSPNGFLDIAGGTLADGDYEWQVRTYDSLGVAGSWSASSFFTAATPSAGPTITAPTSGATVDTSPFTVAWSFPTQQGYQVRRVADIAGSADTTTVFYDSGQVLDVNARSLDVAFETDGRYEHVQVRVKSGGLWSDWADVRVQVSYTAPPAPSLALTPVSTLDPPYDIYGPNAIEVAVTTGDPATHDVPAAILGPTLLTDAVLHSTEAAITSGSFSHTSGGLIVVLAAWAAPTSFFPTLTISDTMGGLTWTRVSNVQSVTFSVRSAIFYAVSNGAAGTVTVTPSRTTDASSGMTLTVYGVTGQGVVGATGTATSHTVSLSAAPASDSMVIAMHAAAASTDPGNAVPAGMTALFTDRHTVDLYDTAGYQIGSAPQSYTFTGGGLPCAVAIEITAGTETVTDPAATSVDIYRSEDGGDTSERVATAQPINGTWTDETPASGVDYSYMAVAMADNGTSTASDWTS